MSSRPLKRTSFILPNLCTPTSILYSILVSLLCTYAWELADGQFAWRSLGLRSLVVQWLVLLSLALLCQLRPYLSRFTERAGFLICFSSVLSMGIGFLYLGQVLFLPQPPVLASLLQQSLALAIITVMVLRFFQLQQQLIEHSNAQVNSQMTALQARIKPHFLFNSLNTIAELINSRPDDAEQAVGNLANLFRANLKESSGLCPLSQELELVRGYLQLEQWRLGERLQVEWQESVADMSSPVPVLCLQPLVENAVVHGVAGSTVGGRIRISVRQTPKIVTLMVENTLYPDSGGHSGHGVGLTNIQQRLRVLYGDRARCRTEQDNEHFKVTLTLPRSHGGEA